MTPWSPRPRRSPTCWSAKPADPAAARAHAEGGNLSFIFGLCARRKRASLFVKGTEGETDMARVLTMAQQKGGSGKTTLLAQLAAIWSAAGRRVALIDLDPQRSLTRWAELRADPALTLVESKDWRAGTDIAAARRAADIVLVDCPGAAERLLSVAIRAADLVLIPAQPSAPDVWATTATLGMCAKERTPARVALNRVPPRGGAVAEAEAALVEAGAELLAARLGNRVAFSTAFLEGRAATETAPRSRAAEEALALADETAAALGAA